MNDPNYETTMEGALDYIESRNLSNQIVVEAEGVGMVFAGKTPVNNGRAIAQRNNYIAQHTRNIKITERLRAKLDAKYAQK
jgi:hypothetical protein